MKNTTIRSLFTITLLSSVLSNFLSSQNTGVETGLIMSDTIGIVSDSIRDADEPGIPDTIPDRSRSVVTISGTMPETPGISLPPSPDAAALGKYGQYPVTLSNGLVQIDIPLYTIELPKISLPVSISYHASGIKVNELPSTVGLGWALNAGGVITRSMKGIPDNNFGSQPSLYRTRNWLLTNMDTTSRINYLQNKYKDERTGAYDTESDVYYYNVAGMTGSFRFDVYGNVVQIPMTKNRIIGTPMNNSSSFTIIGDDGTEYCFNDRELTDTFSGMGTYISAWYLTFIKTTDGRKIDFDYIEDTNPYTDYFVNYQLEVSHDSPYPHDLTSSTTFVQNNTTKLLQAIRFPNGSINFSYNSDRKDRRKYRLTGIEVKQNNQRVKAYSLEHGYFSPSSSLTHSQASTNNRDQYRLKLDKLIMRDASHLSVGAYNFSYNSSAYLPAYINTYGLAPNYGGAEKRYFGQDYWGYYNGVATNGNLFTCHVGENRYNITVPQANRMPNEHYTKACILEEITFPTGGKTRFEYEIHKYDLQGEGKPAGGLRIKQVTSYSDNATITRVYDYQPGRVNLVGWEQPSGDRYSQGHLDGSSSIKVYDYYQSESPVPLAYSGGSSVYYSNVTEYEGSATTNYYGKTEYLFNSAGIDIDYLCPCMLPTIGDYPFFPYLEYRFYDRGWKRGQLQKTKVYKQTGTTFSLIKETRYTYNNLISTEKHMVGFKAFANVSPSQNFVNTNTYPFNHAEYLYQYMNLEVETGLIKLKKIEETDYLDGVAVTQTTEHFYDRLSNQYEVTETHQTRSDGKILKTSYTYPKDINTGVYNAMASLNMLTPVIKKTERLDTNFIEETETVYKSWSVMNGYAPSVIKQKRGTGSVQTKVEYVLVDAKGNPVFVTLNGTDNVVYLWGYNHQYVIAKIENISYTTFTNTIGQALVNSLASSASPNMTTVNNLRNSLPGSLVTTYTYKPLIGVTAITDPKGLTTTYEYDSYNRLKTVKDPSGNIIEEYTYNYRNK